MLSKWKRKIDRWFEELCIGLDDWFSGSGGVALAGEALAGWRWETPLPTDRRLGDHISARGSQRTDWAGDVVIGESQNSNENSCQFWAYCHMLGWPCHFCGGKNHLSGKVDATKLQCPPEAPKLGGLWAGCCKTPSGGVKHMGWWDCCIPVKPGKRMPGNCSKKAPCKNWPEAKNWCAGHGKYYCTIAVHLGKSADESCKDALKEAQKYQRAYERVRDWAERQWDNVSDFF